MDDLESTPLLRVNSSPPEAPPGFADRVRSMDALRGLAALLFAFVHPIDLTGGPRDLRPTGWTGLALADTVPALLLFAQGASLALALEGRREGAGRAVRRSVVLFALGVAANLWEGGGDLSTLQVMGFVQRQAVAQLLVLAVLQLPAAAGGRARQPVILTAHALQWSAMLAAAGLFLALTFAVPEPCDGGDKLSRECNFAAYLDEEVFGTAHIGTGDTGMPFEEDGIMASLGATVSVYLGVHAGRVFFFFRKPENKLLHLLGCGVLTLVMGAASLGGVPVNRPLWSISFSLLLGGTSYVLLALLFWAGDIVQARGLGPLVHIGRNALLVTCGTVVMPLLLDSIHDGEPRATRSLWVLLQRDVFESWLTEDVASAVLGACAAAFWAIVAAVLGVVGVFVTIK